MLEKLKAIVFNIGGIAIGIVVAVLMFGLMLLSLLFKIGIAAAIVWISVKLYPYLVGAMEVGALLFIVLFLPLSIIKRVRPVSGRVAIGVAWIGGFVLVIECGIVTYQNWGWIGAIVGLLFFGIGLIPVAFVSSLFAGQWSFIGEIALSIAFIAIFTWLGKWLLSNAQPRSPSDTDRVTQGSPTS